LAIDRIVCSQYQYKSRWLLILYKLLKDGFYALEYLLWGFIGIDVIDFSFPLELIQHFFGLSIISRKPFANDFNIIITSTTTLGSLQQTSQHLLLATLEMQDKRIQRELFCSFTPGIEVLQIARKSVDEEVFIVLLVG
jgi:hypothetical protein